MNYWQGEISIVKGLHGHGNESMEKLRRPDSESIINKRGLRRVAILFFLNILSLIFFLSERT